MGIIHARPYEDPRNTIIVDNNDPNARDRRFVGTLGVHPEQRCCDDKPPSRLPEMTGWYVDSNGRRIVQITVYWSRPENRARAPHGWWNADTPPGYYVEFANTGRLMCDGCFGTHWDEFLDNLSTTFDHLVPVIRGIAMVISYIPVLGTAVSFVLNASVTLAQGGDLEDAALDGIAGALPGQPASGAAFNAARSLVRGDRIDRVAIAALPVDASVKEAISSAVEIAIALAQGQSVTAVAMDQIYARLPEEGKRAVDLARRAARGENVGDIAIERCAAIVRERGEAAIDKFVAEAGFQGSMGTLDPTLQAAITTGLLIGNAERHQYIGPLWRTHEINVPALDEHAARGRQLMDSGIEWFGRRVLDIRSGSAFTFTREMVDPFTGVLRPETVRHDVTDSWRRGFDVAFGLCEGKSTDDQEQQTVRGWLGHSYASQGFDVAQAMQHYRTWAVIRGEAHPDALRYAQAAPRPAPDAIRGTADSDWSRHTQPASQEDPNVIRGTADLDDLLQHAQPAQPTTPDAVPFDGEHFLFRNGRFA